MPALGTARRLTVRAGQVRIRLDARMVLEIIRPKHVTRVPHSPPALLGMVQTRGAALPVVSLGRLLGAVQPAAPDRVVVLHGTPGIGLAVDAVDALTAADGVGGAPDAHHLRLDEDGTERPFDLDAALKAHFSEVPRARGVSAAHQSHGGLATGPRPLAFLSFTLAGQAYALPLDTIREVLRAPAALTAVPATERVLVGTMDLRGHAMPVVSLRALLGLSERPLQPGDTIIVIPVQGQRIGLLVDRLCGLLRPSHEDVRPAPTLFNPVEGDAKIASVVRMADRRDFVSVLDPAAVAADGRVTRLLAEAKWHEATSVTGEAGARAAMRERFLLLRFGAKTYGLPLAAVGAVSRFPQTLTRLPRAPADVRGVMSLRGKVVPVLDQRRRFSLEMGAEAPARRIVVVTLGTLQAAYAVDEVTGILDAASASIFPAPEPSDGGERLWDRVAALDGGSDGDDVLLMDPQALLAHAEADLLRDLVAPLRRSVGASAPAPARESRLS